MKIAVAAGGDNLEAQVDPRFGRCAWFVIVDSDTMAFEAAQNPGVMAGGGAGIQAAQLVASMGAQVVVAGNMGPNAHQALSAAGIQILPFAGGTVRQAVEAVKAGNLTVATAPTVPSHFGIGGATPTAPQSGLGPGAGLGRGAGMGGGMGRGAGRGFAPAVPTPTSPGSASEELDALKQEADSMRTQLEDIMARIERLESR
jgi:predicted Fe-Mo cluster-binding NifX family protein